jgi:hypothetical protein
MKLRVSHVIVQPVLVWDDGEELKPGPQAQPVQLPLSALAGMADQIKAEIAAQETQLLHNDGGE